MFPDADSIHRECYTLVRGTGIRATADLSIQCWQNAESCRQQADLFADEYAVATFDPRGHGQTGAIDSRRYSIDLVDDLERLLAELGTG